MGSSRDINNDSFSCNLKLFFSFRRIYDGDVTNSWLDDKLPLAGLWLVLVEVILSKERIQNYSSSLFQGKWNSGSCKPSSFENLIY